MYFFFIYLTKLNYFNSIFKISFYIFVNYIYTLFFFFLYFLEKYLFIVCIGYFFFTKNTILKVIIINRNNK